ncbi:hypothetical protein WDU94_014886 [Cyamophila willieti]
MNIVEHVVLSVAVWEAIWVSCSGLRNPYAGLREMALAVENGTVIDNPDVWKVMATVNRSYFQIKDFVYENSNNMPVHIGYGYYCEAPHIIKKILVILEPYLKRPKSHILEIGTGSGYLTVCMNQLLHEKSAILSLEINLQLLNRTINTVKNYYTKHGMKLNKNQTVFLWWNGKRGIYSRSPFDVIYCSGLISDGEYNKLMYQIKPNGILLGYDWEIDGSGGRTLWLKQWYKITDTDVKCKPVIKCDHYYRELMKNKGLLKLNDIMGGMAKEISMDKHGRVMLRDER